MMKKLKPCVGLFCLMLLSQVSFSQSQSSDDEGFFAAGNLKKIDKKAKYGASVITTNIEFGTAKGLTGEPVVTAREKGVVELVSMDDKTDIGYLLPGNDFVKIKDYDFQVYTGRNFKNQKYPPIRVSLTGDNIFFDDSYGQFYGFRAEEKGQRSRFIYDEEYTDAKYLTRVFFAEGFPIKQKVISFKVPSWLNLNISEKNFAGYKIKKDVQQEKNTTIYTYTADNIPSLARESRSLAYAFYLPHLVITVKNFTINQKKITGFENVGDVYKWYNFLYKQAKNTPDAFKAQVNTLVQGKSTDDDKIRAIYYWVQDNIRYIAFEDGYAGFIPQTAQDVYKNKYGDCKGMANLLTEMLKQAGFDAHFAWIGTRDIPYDRNEVQSLCVDNHAICVLYHQGKTYFLDGTEKYTALGKDAYRIQGKSVLVEHGDEYKIEKVPVPPVADNQIITKASLKLDGNKLKGHISIVFDGETRHMFHYIYNNIPADKRKEFIDDLLECNANAEASNAKTSDFSNREIPVSLEGDIVISNQVTNIDNVLYTSIDLFPRNILGFTIEDTRKAPIDLDGVFEAVDHITLELPADKKNVNLPKPFAANFSDNKAEAVYELKGSTLSLDRKTVISSPVIKPTEFAAFKEFINKIKEFNRSSIAIQ